LSVATNRETEADRSKGKGPASSRSLPIQPRTESYPFVTTGGGGGALPLPIGAFHPWALAVTLRRASTAAARASFFMKDSPFVMTLNRYHAAALVL
jgi:hypothetical protein